MKSKEVLNLLKITRPTLTKYVKENIIRVIEMPNGKKLDSEEIFEEIVSLLHCYSMKMYSKRKNKKIQEVIKCDSSESWKAFN